MKNGLSRFGPPIGSVMHKQVRKWADRIVFNITSLWCTNPSLSDFVVDNPRKCPSCQLHVMP